LFRPSKISTKFVSAKFQYLSSVGALRHSKIFVNHKFQSNGDKHHRLLAVGRKGYMRSQESSLTASIEYVASAYYCLCSSFFSSSSLSSVNFSRSSCYFYYASGGFTLFDCNVLDCEQSLFFFSSSSSVRASSGEAARSEKRGRQPVPSRASSHARVHSRAFCSMRDGLRKKRDCS